MRHSKERKKQPAPTFTLDVRQPHGFSTIELLSESDKARMVEGAVVCDGNKPVGIWHGGQIVTFGVFLTASERESNTPQ